MEKTFAIIKPDAVERNLIGKIVTKIEDSGLRVVALRMVNISKKEAEGFYYVHAKRPFFGELTAYMSSGTVVVMVLEGENAIARWRKLMGATNPAEAESGTIRKEFALNIEKNSVHGSDSPESVAYEIPYFFSSVEIPR